MPFIADLHIHSKYSLATSRELTPEWLDYWARLKGINVLGTGDCIHPRWLEELKKKLMPVGNGLHTLRDTFRIKDDLTSNLGNLSVFFMLQTEISTIYKKNGLIRKVHSLCYFPDFKSAEFFQKKLNRIGNIHSDGRPIVGYEAKDICAMVLETGDESFVVPAHIWTPWFSLFGSKSGFGSIEECYEDLTPFIFAVETGLSSDPPMNRRCSVLDNVRLISNSDAHSPDKLGREANIFDCELSYHGIYDALKSDRGFLGTIEFYPEQGKYHGDGHRKCGICWQPDKTLKHNGICPVCGKEVTKGVAYRVEELADRERPDDYYGKQTYSQITPLSELIREIQKRKNARAKSVKELYVKLIKALGPEFFILLEAASEDIKQVGGELCAEGIDRLRTGKVKKHIGYDGEFGRVRVFDDNEL